MTNIRILVGRMTMLLLRLLLRLLRLLRLRLRNPYTPTRFVRHGSSITYHHQIVRYILPKVQFPMPDWVFSMVQFQNSVGPIMVVQIIRMPPPPPYPKSYHHPTVVMFVSHSLIHCIMILIGRIHNIPCHP